MCRCHGWIQESQFPRQSGSDGQEETQKLNLNPRSRRWVPDNSYLQRRVGSAVALNVWQYFQVTHDIEFLHAYGAEMIFDIACFWSGIAHFNSAGKSKEYNKLFCDKMLRLQQL